MTAPTPSMAKFRTEFVARLGSRALDDLSHVVRRRTDHADEPAGCACGRSVTVCRPG
jgi:hypothetical protein